MDERNRSSYIFLSLMLLLVVFLLIYKASSSYSASYFFIIYTGLILVYISSRFIGSFLYEPYQVKQMHDLPSVSFIIPVYNEEKAISKTILKCFNTEYPKNKVEVIASDDGSTDDSLQILNELKNKFPNLKVIPSKKNQGKRFAMAAAIKVCRGEIIVQLDSDSYLEKDSLIKLVSVLEDRKIAGVSAHTDPENAEENLLTKMQAAYYFCAFRIHKAAESMLGMVFCCSGCCSAYRKEYVMPLLDEWMNERHFGVKTTYGDDRSLTNLLIREGYQTAYCDNAQAYTIVPNTLNMFMKQQRRWKKSWVICTARTSTYILKRDPFVGIVYFFPQLIMNYMAPILIIALLVIIPFYTKSLPIYLFLGVFLIYSIVVLYSFYYKYDKTRYNIFAWVMLNIFLCAFIFPYALLTLKDNEWGTR